MFIVSDFMQASILELYFSYRTTEGGELSHLSLKTLKKG